MSELASLMPPIDESNRPYWDGLRERQIRMPRCEECGAFRFRHSRYCPGCGSDRTKWHELSGRGRLWARCVFHQVYFPAFRERVPYGVVVVELDEGVRLYSNLVDVESTMEVPIGAPLEAVYEDISDDVTLLKFRPA
jgi:uncharacterized protein